MMEQGKKFLSDILRAIELIESFVPELMTYSDFVSDLKTQSAVERQLGIIGEAVNKFEFLTQDISINHARKIVGLRNRLILAYDAIDSSIVWVIIKKHLIPLKEEVLEMLQ